MKPIDSDSLDRLQKQAPSFKTAVDDCKKRKRTLMTNLESFEGNYRLFYDAVWYALTEGVAVTIISGNLENKPKKSEFEL